MEHRLDENSSKRNQYIATIIATGICAASGMGFGWVSPITPKIIANNNGTCSYDFCIDKSEVSLIASLMGIGSLIGCPFAWPASTRFGRKRAICGYFCVSFAGWLVLTFAKTSWLLYLGRFLSGFGNASTIVVPIYIGEISQISIRGELLSFVHASMSGATMVQFILGNFVGVFVQNLICVVILVVFGCALYFMPESPRYLTFVGQTDKAKASLRWLRGTKFDTDKEIQDIIEFQNTQASKKFTVLFTDKTNRRAFIIVASVLVGFELSGMTAMLFYASSIFEGANIGLKPSVALICVGVCTFTGTIFAMQFVDRLGRRPILIISYAILCVCFVVLGVYSQLQSNNPASVVSWQITPVIALCVYIFVNSGGTIPVAHVLMGELFAQNVKDAGATLSMLLNNVTAIGVALLFPVVDEGLGAAGLFFIFCALVVGNLVLVVWIVPETKGKSFAEIQELLARNKRK